MARDRASFRVGPSVDMPLLVSAVVIVTLGLVNLYSATSVYVDSLQRARLADVGRVGRADVSAVDPAGQL